MKNSNSNYQQIDYNSIVEEERFAYINSSNDKIIEYVGRSNNLLEKFVLLRRYTGPQSNVSEKIIKTDLQIDNPINNTSGDGHKNGNNFEIKASIHAKDCALNIRQIRPHHTIDFYIVIHLDIFSETEATVTTYKIPSNDLYNVIPQFGGYTHGTVKNNGKITIDSIYDDKHSFEYSITYSPMKKTKGKNKEIKEFLEQYITLYDPKNF